MFTDEIIAKAENILTLCRQKKIRLVTAESCTGGLIAACLTAIPGSSEILEAGFVTYANSAKETMLGIAPSLIRTKGAVSEEVALAMARGALGASSADLAIAVTGIAGPDGGSAEKPVGLVHIAIATASGNIFHDARITPGTRGEIREKTVLRAFKLIADILPRI